jgi:hypothetical protein
MNAVANGKATTLAKAAKQAAKKEEPSEPTLDDRMAAWNKAVESFARKINGLISEAPEGPWMDGGRRDIIKSQLASAANTARAIKGHASCAYCGGDGCKKCRSTGWLNKIDSDSAPERKT